MPQMAENHALRRLSLQKDKNFRRFFCVHLVMRFFSTQMYCEGSEELMEQHALEPSQIQIRQGKEKKFMRNVIAKLDMAVFKAKTALMQKKEASDQLIVMFIIIAVAAGIAGLLYIFATGTLLPNFQNKLTTLINNWVNHS